MTTLLDSSARRPLRVRCPPGGYAPCIDDLCHSGGQTLCLLEPDFDFCWHGYDPETCDQGCAHDGDDDYPYEDDER